ncbi:MAG: Fumarate reductase iron-sulfur subunit [Chlamydiae bacterium]|nr:Fumarate reductase iron-sulfur subunit [Chlamydiota bacterium]
MSQTYTLKIYRGTPDNQYWEEFELEQRPYLNITAALMDVQKNPVNKKGEKVTPPAWEQGCLEVVCGSCSMLVNGRPVQACVILVEKVLKATGSNVITLAPFTKFPLVKDLVVDRGNMFENLKKIHAWVEVDDALDRGFGPKVDPKIQEERYILSTCITCGCCTEACPQINPRSNFIGPAPISQVRLFNAHPTGKHSASDRLHALMGEGGITDCGNAQNCVQVCPKDIPLTESISLMGRKVAGQAIRDLLNPADSKE